MIYKVEKYLIDFQNEAYYTIDIKIEPCMKSDGSKVANCQPNVSDTSMYNSNYEIEKAGPDLQIAWKITNKLIQCSNEFKNQDWCGTFLEIHRPLDSRILNQ